MAGAKRAHAQPSAVLCATLVAVGAALGAAAAAGAVAAVGRPTRRPTPPPAPACSLQGVSPPCECVRPQTNVTWRQISGTWYLVEASQSAGVARDVCYGITLSSNTKAGFEQQVGEERYYSNTTLEPTSPSTWFERDLGYYTHVAVYSESLSSMVLVSCVPIFSEFYQWTGIFNRAPAPSRQTINAVHALLPGANMSPIQNPRHYNNRGCL